MKNTVICSNLYNILNNNQKLFENKHEIDKIYYLFINNNKIDESSYILLIKIFCKINEPDNSLLLLFKLINNNITPKLRFFIPILEFYSNIKNYKLFICLYDLIIYLNIEPNIEVFTLRLKCINNDKNLINNLLNDMKKHIKYVNEDFLNELKFNKILIKLDNIGRCCCCNHIMNLHNINKEVIRNYILNNNTKYERPFKKLNKYLNENCVYDILIDGGNIGYFLNNKDKNFNYDNIIKIYNDLTFNYNKKVCIFLNKSRVKESINLNNINVFTTPIGIDDDLFWIQSSLFNEKTFVLTNDELKNHILNCHELNNWKINKRVTYSYNYKTNSFNYNFPLNYSISIQNFNNNIWHLPIDNFGNIFCTKIEDVVN
jgi:hypothetical protein